MAARGGVGSSEVTAEDDRYECEHRERRARRRLDATRVEAAHEEDAESVAR